MAHKACFEHCVKRASLSSYFSALFFLLVPYGGDTVSTLTVRTWREIHLPKHVPEQKCLWSKGFQPRAHRWCRGRPEHPHSLKCCIVMVCTCVHTWIFFFLGRKSTYCQILNRIHYQKCLELLTELLTSPVTLILI